MKEFFLLAFFWSSCALVFTIFPSLDIYVSTLFYSFNSFHTNDLLNGISEFLFIFPMLTFGLLSLSFLISKSDHYKKALKLVLSCAAVYVFCCLFVSHIGMKAVFHRPRPENILQFGGKMHFIKAFQIKGECLKKCSFVSTHAMTGYAFSLISAFYYNIRKLRNRVIIASFIIGTACGITRIMLGKHFLSDVVVAGLIAYTATFMFTTFTDKKFITRL
ncbi:putative PAP2 family phosphatase [Candidatus Fokinia solitaria]|uniref:Putative PAP2 family phosphatase n=1 Tax=Candidatus Fokinia solitaria TaxID=1802984 RepID=A0A2U8BRU4_9RICK|nr:phosphatase PAP2 family protein [Candidatus Fokinia solitaria]AWD33061.1 putative PAP2 family phosphatase [Candidatus Fokinia solitaria]